MWARTLGLRLQASGAASATTSALRQRCGTDNLPRTSASVMTCDTLLASAAGLLPDDAAVLDTHNAAGERQGSRIVRFGQDPARLVLRDLGEQGRDGLAVLGIQRAGRFVREDGRRLAHDGPRDRDTLLFAAAEFTRKGLYLVARPTRPSTSLAALRCDPSPRTSSAKRTLSSAVRVGNRW